MKSTGRYVVVTLCFLGLFASVGRSQDLFEQLQKLGADAAPKYISPIFGGWGSDLNSGLYHSADLHSVLGFDVGIKFMAAGLTDEDKFYDLTLPPTITFNTFTLQRGTDYDESVRAQTVVGAETATEVKVKNTSPNVPLRGQTILTLPGGFDFSTVPMLVPQVNIGLPFGLEVMGRFIPSIKAGDMGKFSFVGFGLRHDVDQYLPLFPIDIAVHFMTQSMTLKNASDVDVLSGTATAYGVEISKKLLILTVYSGFQLESSSFTVASLTGVEPSTGASVTIPEFTVDGRNSSRLIIGARVLLLILNAHIEYSVATVPTLTMGVGLSFR